MARTPVREWRPPRWGPESGSRRPPAPGNSRGSTVGRRAGGPVTPCAGPCGRQALASHRGHRPFTSATGQLATAKGRSRVRCLWGGRLHALLNFKPQQMTHFALPSGLNTRMSRPNPKRHGMTPTPAACHMLDFLFWFNLIKFCQQPQKIIL